MKGCKIWTYLVLAVLLFCIRPCSAQSTSEVLVDSILTGLSTLPNDSTKADSLSTLSYQMHVHDPIVGLQLANSAFRLSDSLKYELGKLRSELCRGLNYYVLTEYPEALHHTLNALSISERMGSQDRIAVCYMNLGIIYRESGDFETAEKYFRQSLEIDKELGDQVSIAKVWWNLAGLAWDRDSLHTALEYFQRSLDIGRKAQGNTGMTMATLGNMASIHSEPGMDPLTGVRLAKEALQMRIEVSETFAEADVFANLAELYLMIAESGDSDALDELFDGNKSTALEAALAAADSAIGLVRVGGLEINKYEYYQLRSDVLEQLGYSSRALDDHKRFTLLKDSAMTIEKDKQFTRKAMQYEFGLKEAATKAEQERKDARNTLIRNGIALGFLGALFFLAIVWRQRNKISVARRRSDELLLNILPEEVAEELKEKGEAEAQLIDHVTVLFTDFRGFTAMSEKLLPRELVKDLNECFSAFDQITEKCGIEKIKTIGDAYMAAGGLPTPNDTHATDVINAALEMRDFVELGKKKKIEQGLPYFEIRIGVHTGPVVAGIVGVKKFQYDIWGDTVNTASRMESSGEVGQVNISQTTYELLKYSPEFKFTPRGKVQAKGKGELEMYFVTRTDLTVNR